MAWKNWPYWLRGGVIGVLIFIITAIFGFMFTYFYFSNSKLLNVNYSIGIEGLARYLVYSIPVFLIYFLIGALIGWIIGKIKSSKQN